MLFFRYVSDFINTLSGQDTGKVYIISSSASRELLEHRGKIAFYLNGWRYLTPKDGFMFFVCSHCEQFIFKHGTWKMLTKKVNIQHVNRGQLDLSLEVDPKFRTVC